MEVANIFITIISIVISFSIIYLLARKSGAQKDYLKAMESMQINDDEIAEKLFKDVLRKTKINNYLYISSLMGLRQIYWEKNLYDESLKYLDDAIQISKKNPKWKNIYSQLLIIKKNTIHKPQSIMLK